MCAHCTGACLSPFSINVTDWFTCVLSSLLLSASAGAHSELSVQFRGVPIQSSLKLSERSRLYLVCVLQFTDPLCLLSLESGNFPLDLHALLVLLVDLVDQLTALVKALLLLVHHAHLDGLVLLVAHHLFHALGLQLLRSLLDLDHFLVLSAFRLQTLSFTVVLLGLSHLLVADGFLLVESLLLVAHLEFTLLMFPLHLKCVFEVGRFSISMAHVDDVVSLLLSFLNLFPSLLLFLLQ